MLFHQSIRIVKSKKMKKHILLLIISFVSVSSHAQYDFLKATLGNISSGPSLLIVKVKLPSYEGDVAIYSDLFLEYYKTLKYKDLDYNKYYPKIWQKKDIKLAYRDIKQGKCFIISDEDITTKDVQYKPYYFRKIIVNDSVLDIAKKGIEFFISTYFDGEGWLKPRSSIDEPFDVLTILKVLFDAEIMTGIGCEYGGLLIQDARFYIVENEERKFVIPPEYRDSKE